MVEENSVATVATTPDLRRRVADWRAAGETVGLVPTMGFLHDGHLALVEAARRRSDRVVVSIFVNPRQFGPNEDFESYPRDHEGDLAKLTAAGADLAFVPDVAAMYGDGFVTAVSVSELTDCLCGANRPGHFDGVATVVTKLLLQCLPDIAWFGEKDFQQLLMIRRMSRDLDIPVEIAAVETVREADGLALSSRNAYLSAEDRQRAGALNQVLRTTAKQIASGDDTQTAIQAARQALSANGIDRIDYLDCRDTETLRPVSGPSAQGARLFAAIHLGDTRLIDNVPIEGAA